MEERIEESQRRGYPRIGILALQGDFAAHAAALRDVGIAAREVRKLSMLEDLDGLVIPGGESTTLLRLMQDEGLTALRDFHAGGGTLLGTCAGLILLARRVVHPEQRSLGLLDIEVERNGYGRQVESFRAAGQWTPSSSAPAEPLEMVFIRAPRIRAVGSQVEVLARWKGEPVLVRRGRILGATFHPELAAGREVHRLFVEMTAGAGRGTACYSPQSLARSS
ncbi:MAG: pyridoxal 5'-phosphate synthase glutaminase subunit PdxT [Candidatus Eisenbacteria bacterium]|nr:pyridoxal 5'-phosphate synthase glutaminase subunit PdxT [Candidatus Eisenbacteria bacterium]